MRVRLTGLARDRYTFRVNARSMSGRSAEELIVPMWVEETPYQWGDGALYFVFTDRFRNGNPLNDGRTGGTAVMPGMIELGEDIFLKAVRRGVPRYSSALSDMVSHPRAATVMGLLEEARLARLRGFRVAQKNGSMKTAMGRVKDWFVGNF
jgi:hypothetical protein